MSIKDFFGDLNEAASERLKNPLVFSFILAWIASNWLLIYQVFTFEEMFTLTTRTQIIAEYVKAHKYTDLTWYPLWKGALISSIYIVASSVYLIAFNFYNVTIKGWINSWSAPGKHAPKNILEHIEKKYNKLLKEDNERKKHITQIEKISEGLQAELDKIERDEATTDIEIHELEEEITGLKEQKHDLENKLREAETFNNRGEIHFKNFFIASKNYEVTLTYTDGSSERPPLSIPSKVKVIDFTIVNINNKQVLYYIEDLKLTGDERMMSFNLRSVNDTTQSFKVYLMRESQVRLEGHLFINNRAARIAFSMTNN